MPTIVIFEDEPYWAPELRRQFLENDSVRVRHCQVVGSVPVASASDVLLVSLDRRERECLELLRQVSGYFVIFIGSESTADLERPFREAGVHSFLTQTLSGEELARRIQLVWAAPV
ncbi:MAG: hypothetical protein AB8G99_11975 [Planctomycetaceae bacterium]